jgi:hypothetical protein
MHTQMITTQTVNQATQLKNIFDRSLAVLSESRAAAATTKGPAKLLHGSSMPIRIDAVSLQKRALDDAARALATLWKVSETKRARM